MVDLGVTTMKKYVYSWFWFAVMLLSFPVDATPKPPNEGADRARQTASAIFAGGCFWCMEPPYDKLEGVIETLSGYSGGDVDNPSYQQVSAGNTEHYEVIKVVYDPAIVSYEQLLDVFWRNVDPLDGKGQFCDKGQQYLSAIFVKDDAEKRKAQASKRKAREVLAKQLGQPLKNIQIVTPILARQTFYPAEDYHQNYYQNNPLKYRYYRYRCGRDARLEELWGKMAAQ